MTTQLTDLFPELFQTHIYPHLSIIDRCRLRGLCRKLRECDLEVVPPESWRTVLRQATSWDRECARLFIDFRAHILFPSLKTIGGYVGKKVVSIWTIDDNWGIKITNEYISLSQWDAVRIKFSDPEGFYVAWRSYKGDYSLHDLFAELLEHMAYVFLSGEDDPKSRFDLVQLAMPHGFQFELTPAPDTHFFLRR